MSSSHVCALRRTAPMKGALRHEKARGSGRGRLQRPKRKRAGGRRYSKRQPEEATTLELACHRRRTHTIGVSTECNSLEQHAIASKNQGSAMASPALGRSIRAFKHAYKATSEERRPPTSLPVGVRGSCRGQPLKAPQRLVPVPSHRSLSSSG